MISRGGGGIRPNGRRGIDIPEERQAHVRDGELARPIPLVQRIVELLRGGQRAQVPRIPALIDVLGVPAHGDRLSLRDARVDAVDGPERVRHGLVVRQGPRRAGLEGRVVAPGLGVERVDAAQDGVGVLARAAAAEVGQDVRARPVGLQEAEDLRRLGDAVGAAVAELLGEGVALHEGAVLHGGGEEGGALDFFPEVCVDPVRYDFIYMRDI